MSQTVTINAKKYNGTIHRSWQGELLFEDDSMLGIAAVFEHDVKHPDLGLIENNTVSFEYFFMNKWFNAFRFHRPYGIFRNWYCNICVPPSFSGDTIDFIDLDIDIVVWPDGRVETLDMKEFVDNAVKFKYPPNIVEGAKTALSELLNLIETAQFPFNYQPQDAFSVI